MAFFLLCFLVFVKNIFGCPYDNEWDCLPITQYQFRGTHNTYHQRVQDYLIPDSYSHADVLYQLDNGIRAVEFDCWLCDEYTSENETVCNDYDIGHVQYYDYNSSCKNATECITIVANWTSKYYNHFPIFLKIELKYKLNLIWNTENIIHLSNLISDLLGNKLYTPIDFGVTTTGSSPITQNWNDLSWSNVLLGDLRGRIIPYLTSGNTDNVFTTFNLTANTWSTDIIFFPSCSDLSSTFCKLVETSNYTILQNSGNDFISMAIVENFVGFIQVPNIQYDAKNNSINKYINSQKISMTINEWSCSQTFACADYNDDGSVSQEELVYWGANYTEDSDSVILNEITELCLLLSIENCTIVDENSFCYVIQKARNFSSSLNSALSFSMNLEAVQEVAISLLDYGMNIMHTNFPFYVSNNHSEEWICTLRCNDSNAVMKTYDYCLQVTPTQCFNESKCSIDQIEGAYDGKNNKNNSNNNNNNAAIVFHPRNYIIVVIFMLILSSM